MANVSMNFKVSSTLKDEFSEVAAGIGISPAALLNLLMKRTVMEKGIPFEVKVLPTEQERRIEEKHKLAMEMMRKNPIFSVQNFETDENGAMIIPDDAPENIKEWGEFG